MFMGINCAKELRKRWSCCYLVPSKVSVPYGPHNSYLQSPSLILDCTFGNLSVLVPVVCISVFAGDIIVLLALLQFYKKKKMLCFKLIQLASWNDPPNGSIFLDCLLLHIRRWLYSLWLTAFLLESFPQPYAKVLIMPKKQKGYVWFIQTQQWEFRKVYQTAVAHRTLYCIYMAMPLWLMYRVLSVGFSWKIL